MGFKAFEDANLLLDFTLQRDKYVPARDIVQLVIDGTIILYTTPAILHIVAYGVAKAYGNVKAKELPLVLLADLKIIDCDHATALMAINSSFDDI